MYFSVAGSEEAREIGWLSGEEIHSYSEDEREVFRPRLSADEILAVSDHPQRLFLHVASGSGYTQFGGSVVPVQTDWPISAAVAKARAAMPWPAVESNPNEELVRLESSTAEVETQVRQKRAAKYAAKVGNLFED